MRIPREREVRQFSLLNILFRVEFRKKKKKIRETGFYHGGQHLH